MTKAGSRQTEELQQLIAEQSQDDQTDQVVPENPRVRNETDTKTFLPRFRMTAIRTRRGRPDVRVIFVGVLGPWSAIDHVAARLDTPEHLAGMTSQLWHAPCPACGGGKLRGRERDRLPDYCLACDRCGDEALAKRDWANRCSKHVIDGECPRSYLGWALEKA